MRTVAPTGKDNQMSSHITELQAAAALLPLLLPIAAIALAMAAALRAKANSLSAPRLIRRS
jgi:hypothetical protein